MTVEGSNGERRSFGDIDSAVEYMNHRPHENFVVYDATIDMIKEIRRRFRGNGNLGFE